MGPTSLHFTEWLVPGQSQRTGPACITCHWSVPLYRTLSVQAQSKWESWYNAWCLCHIAVSIAKLRGIPVRNVLQSMHLPHPHLTSHSLTGVVPMARVCGDGRSAKSSPPPHLTCQRFVIVTTANVAGSSTMSCTSHVIIKTAELVKKFTVFYGTWRFINSPRFYTFLFGILYVNA
jgi:hypothetical protein